MSSEPLCHFCPNDEPMGFNLEDGTLIGAIPALYSSSEIFICEKCYAEDDVEHRAAIDLGYLKALEADLAAKAKAEKGPRDCELNVRMTKGTRERLDSLAKATDQTLNGAVNTLLEFGLKMYFMRSPSDP